VSRYKVDIKWGIIFTVVAILWMAIERLAGLHSDHIDQHALYSNFFGIAAIAVYVFAVRDKKANHFDGQMSYKQGFICGLVVTLVAAILAPLSQYLSVSVISPNYFANMIAYTVSEGVKTQTEAEDFFNLKAYITMAVPMVIGAGTLTSAVVAIFLRTK
jgi:hypothetical protein